jgi:hypothetical protein
MAPACVSLRGALRLRVGWVYVHEAGRKVLVKKVWGRGWAAPGVLGGAAMGGRTMGLGGGTKSRSRSGAASKWGRAVAPCCSGSKLSPRSLPSWMRLATRARLAT